MQTGLTPGGIRYALRSAGSAVAYCSLSIKAGTRYEGSFPEGTAHFTEHCIFKGTSRRSASAINNALESLGGELNAYTTKEEIVLHATVLKKDLRKAVDLLMDMAFDSLFPDAQIQKEKTVVLDEIASYKDSPAESVYDKFEEMLFEGSPLSRPILGSKSSVKKISAANLRDFSEAMFSPRRMCISVVSPFDEGYMAKLVADVEKRYRAVEDRRNSNPDAACPEETQPPKVRFNQMVDKKNYQVNCVMGAFAPSLAESDDRVAALLLCNMLGGPAMNSILGSRLRERNGWVYNIECSYTPYADSGIAAVIFGCDKCNLEKCLQAVRKELDKLCAAPLSESRLRAAKRQFLGQNSIAMENGEAQCLSMGKSMLSFGRVMDDDKVVEKIQGVTAGKVLEVARRMFSPEKVNVLIYK